MGAGRQVKRFIGATFPRLLLFRGGNSTEPVVALTFDDGPHPEHSPEILGILAKHRIRASFFVIGKEAEKYPDLIKRMLAEGHEVANHSYSHYDAVRKTPVGYAEDVEHCQKVLESICGQELKKNFRPPYGTIHPVAFMRLARLGYRFVLWSLDSNDSRVKGADELTQSFAGSTVVSGDVILLHEDYAHTPQALPDLLKVLKERGFGFVTCDEF